MYDDDSPARPLAGLWLLMGPDRDRRAACKAAKPEAPRSTYRSLPTRRRPCSRRETTNCSARVISDVRGRWGPCRLGMRAVGGCSIPWRCRRGFALGHRRWREDLDHHRDDRRRRRRASTPSMNSFPETPSVRIGDVSDVDGGRLKRHQSHQSGRTCDVGFYFRGWSHRSLRRRHRQEPRPGCATGRWCARGSCGPTSRSILLDTRVQKLLLSVRVEHWRRQGPGSTTSSSFRGGSVTRWSSTCAAIGITTTCASSIRWRRNSGRRAYPLLVKAEPDAAAVSPCGTWCARARRSATSPRGTARRSAPSWRPTACDDQSPCRAVLPHSGQGHREPCGTRGDSAARPAAVDPICFGSRVLADGLSGRWLRR